MLTEAVIFPRATRHRAAETDAVSVAQFAAMLRRRYYTATQWHEYKGPAAYDPRHLSPLDCSAMLILPRIESQPEEDGEPFAFQLSPMPGTSIGSLPNLICVAPNATKNDPLLRRFRTEYMRFACELQVLDALTRRFRNALSTAEASGESDIYSDSLSGYIRRSLDRIVGSLSQIDIGAPGWPLRLSETLTRQGLADEERLSRLRLSLDSLVEGEQIGRGLADTASKQLSELSFHLEQGATLQIGDSMTINDESRTSTTVIKGNSGPVNTGDRAVVGHNQSNINTGDGNAIQFGEYSSDDVTADLDTLSKQLETEAEAAKKAGNETEAENCALKKTLLQALQAKVKEAVEAVDTKAVFDAVKSAGKWILEKAQEYKLPALLFVARKAFALP